MEEKDILYYEIPSEVKREFTKEMMSCFHDKMIEVFKENDIKHGRKPLEYEKFTFMEWWFIEEGTGGWYDAFEYMCISYGLEDILHYYKELPWYHADLFDDQFGDLLIEYGLVEMGETPDECFEDYLYD